MRSPPKKQRFFIRNLFSIEDIVITLLGGMLVVGLLCLLWLGV